MDRRATVRLHIELFCIILISIKTRSLWSCLSEFQSAYLNKNTLIRNNSLLIKVGLRIGQSKATDQGKVSLEVKQVICEVKISTGHINRWFTSNSPICEILPCKLQIVSFCNNLITTKFTALSIRKMKRSEDSLQEIEQKTQPHYAIPVNHDEVKVLLNLNGMRKSTARTFNTRRYLWDRGPVILHSHKVYNLSKHEGRGLNTWKKMITQINFQSYSTKSQSKALSWNDTKVAQRLLTLWNGNLKNRNFINEGLWKLLNSIDLWKAAYIKLSNSKGSTTPSFDEITIDGMTLQKLEELKKELVEGRYKFGTTKRLFIPKGGSGSRPTRGTSKPLPGGSRSSSSGTKGKVRPAPISKRRELIRASLRTRPLGIPPFNDRLIQEVIRTILEVIYEPIFSNHSHGFRPGRSCLTALRHIKQKSNGFSWAIEGDITSFFDNIDHNILLYLISKKIKDQKFINLVNHLLKTKVKEEGKKEFISFIGSPQGSIISPLFSNIVLHEFDIFMEEYINKYNKGKNRKKNPLYDQLYINKGIQAARKVPYFKYDDPSYRRLHYVRYADDFIITIIGPKKEALEIKANCSKFLNELKLKLNEEKTLITNPKSRRIPFLGYLIQKSPKQKFTYFRKYAGKIKEVSIIRGGQIYLLANLQKVKQSLAEKGFCMRSGYPIANFTFLSDTQYGTILKVSRILIGISNYYILARNYRSFVSRINYIIRYSIAKLFAAKFKLRSISKVFSIAGKNLSKPLYNSALITKKSIIGQTEENIYAYLESKGISANKLKKNKEKLKLGIPYTKYKDIRKPDLAPLNKNFNLTFKEILTSSSSSDHTNPLNSLNWRVSRSSKLVGAICIICDSTENIEMHHIRGIKYLKGISIHTVMMKRLNRIQIPLCRIHHKMVHKNGLMALLKHKI